jgi:aspartyl-tRNA synthetase
MYRTHTCGELRLENAGQTVTLAGWVQKNRKMGGMSFIDLRDRYGITQVVIDESSSSELNEKVACLGREYVIQVTGTVEERQSKNPRIPTGEIEIKLTHLNILNEAATPPFTIEDESDGGDMHFAFDGDPEGKIRLLLDYTEHSRNIADPWYTGDFQATWDDVNEGCDALLTDLGFI